MTFPAIITTRPVCTNCGKKCGTRYRNWPIEQHDPLPWDGKSWLWKYNPFCTLRCGLAYARAAIAKAEGNQ